MEIFNTKNYVAYSVLLLALLVIRTTCGVIWSACPDFVYGAYYLDLFGFYLSDIFFWIWAIFTIIVAIKVYLPYFRKGKAKVEAEKNNKKAKAKRK